MVKLNRTLDSDDELPELSTIIAEGTSLSFQKQRARLQESSGKRNPWERPRSTIHGLNSTTELLDEKHGAKKQRPLKIAHVNSILLSLTNRSALSIDPPNGRRRPNVRNVVRGPRKQNSSLPSVISPIESEGSSSDIISGFVVYDSESEDSEESPHDPTKRCLPSRTQDNSRETSVLPSPRGYSDDREETQLSNKTRNAFGSRNHGEGEPTESAATRERHGKNVQSPSNSITNRRDNGLEEPNSILRFIDAFWSQEVINDWNDSYTPKKPAQPSPLRNTNAIIEDDKHCTSPCQTGRRSPSKSLIKADKEAAERRKAFNKEKYQLAAAFLTEIDQTIVNGQVAKLAESTGGVRLVWSKKLQSTAGRANWRREAIRTKDAGGELSTTTYRNHASIELAEKVIDDEDRLINVIAHEYCHLLNFMISNIKDNPHGKEFKIWAKKCSAAFAHRGVNVTTTHVYEISYKHSCGKCHEKLVQVKPTPRREGKGTSEYQKFVKQNFARLKRERPEMSMGEVMASLGKEFREAKEKGAGEVVVPVDEIRNLDGDGDPGLESVVRKLDFLELGKD
ncbi:MAG: hypothetical protein Q9221_001189 [Calogaya cf. arnoldii]